MKSSYTVYAKPNSDGYITAVNSSAFLADTDGWVEIDRGTGDGTVYRSTMDGNTWAPSEFPDAWEAVEL